MNLFICHGSLFLSVWIASKRDDSWSDSGGQLYFLAGDIFSKGSLPFFGCLYWVVVTICFNVDVSSHPMVLLTTSMVDVLPSLL